VRIFQTSVFGIDLEDAAVDCVFRMRLLYHVGLAEHRFTMPCEFHRAARETLVISFMADGNYKDWRYKHFGERGIRARIAS
jgi:hypothetical protein